MHKRATSHRPLASFWRTVQAIMWKDLTSELRHKEIVSAMFIFSLLVVLIFNFSLELDRATRDNVAAGVLWVTFVFAATLGLNRTFAAEKDRDLLDGLLLAPIDRSALFVGKMLSTFIFIIIVESIVVPLFSLLYTVSLFTPLLLAVLVLGTLGYTVVGTLLAAIAIHTRSREIMLPILLFPVAVPVIIASVQASAGILEGNALGNISGPLNLVVVYDIIIFAIAIMTFDYLIEE